MRAVNASVLKAIQAVKVKAADPVSPALVCGG
jgi:hypothetical protein